METADITAEGGFLRQDFKAACSNIDMVYINDRKSYVALASNVVEHVITNKNVTKSCRLFYLLADAWAGIKEHTDGCREIELSGAQWAKHLGLSEGWVFQAQKELESLGFFKIIREKDEDNQNEKNIIVPTLPNTVWQELKSSPNRNDKFYLEFIPREHEGCKRSFLDSSKLFIKFNFKMLKMVIQDENLSSQEKLIWIHAFTKSYRAYTNAKGEGERVFYATHKELSELFSCSKETISKSLANLRDHGYLTMEQIKVKDKEKSSRRYKKSVWKISAVLPKEKSRELKDLPDRDNLPELSLDEQRFYFTPDTPLTQQAVVHTSKVMVEKPEGEISLRSPEMSQRSGEDAKTCEYSNKDPYISNSNCNKNIDTKCDNGLLETSTKSNQSCFSVLCEEKIDEIFCKAHASYKKFEALYLKYAHDDDHFQALRNADQKLSDEEHRSMTIAAQVLHARYKRKATDEETQVSFRESLKDFEDALLDQVLYLQKPEDETEEHFTFLINRKFLINDFEQYIFHPKDKHQAKLNEVKDESSSLVVQKYQRNKSALPDDKVKKAISFAHALKDKGLAKGYAAEISKDDLAMEFIHHAASWKPDKIKGRSVTHASREEQIDAALSIAWRKAESGMWSSPYEWREITTLDWEREYFYRKSSELGFVVSDLLKAQERASLLAGEVCK